MRLQLLKNTIIQSVLKIFYLQKDKSSLLHLHLIINNPLHSITKQKLKIVRKVVPEYKGLEKRMLRKQKSEFIKKTIGTEITRKVF